MIAQSGWSKQGGYEVYVENTSSGLELYDHLFYMGKEFDVKLSEIAYIGDDVNDLEIMKKIGFSACPKDGVMQIRKIASYICSLNGGNGAFRELVDVIIASKKNNS